MYYTTPIYQFRMKCHLCTNHFSIKTDPANLDYIIVEGATRQERRWDPSENGQVSLYVWNKIHMYCIYKAMVPKGLSVLL